VLRLRLAQDGRCDTPGSSAPSLADGLFDIRVTRDIYQTAANAIRRVVAQLAPDVEPAIKVVTTRG
jgi:hypothetical protein